jgi:hypothetical protein
MLSESSVGIIMAGMQEILTSKLEKEGYIYPSLVLMRQGSYVDVQDLRSKYPCLLAAERSIGINDIFITTITLRNRDEDDDQAIIEFIREVTFKHKPEAVGYIAQCLYKPMKKEESDILTTNQMNSDPDAIRVIHNCFFVKGGSPKGYLMVTPYILNTVKKQEEEAMFLGADERLAEKEHVYTPMNKTWEEPSYALETRIKNPYV